jgi:membrane-bound lytic murein transglycosylase B
MRTPAARGAVGVAVLAPLILAGAVGASSPAPSAPRDAAVTPLAAVEPAPRDRSGPSVVAVTKSPTAFHIAAATVSAPPPAYVVNSPGSLRIPAMALSAYRNAERLMAAAYPRCGVSWNLLAGIGRIESMHANGGATDARGTVVRPIYGPALDGTLPGNEIIVQSRTADRIIYARAMGPMQFLPGTWARYAADGDGDGKANVQNLFDSTLAAARYLCSGGLNLRDQSQVMSAILRYNNSVAYARNVLSWAAGYATGVVPVDLPPLVGPVAPIGDLHLDNPEGLGPGLPVNATGLPANDPLALVPLMGRADASQIPTTNVPGFAPGQLLGPLPGPLPAPRAAPPAPAQPQPWLPPWMPPPPQPTCVVFCLSEQAPPPAPGLPGLPAPQGAPLVPAPNAPAPPLPGPPPPLLSPPPRAPWLPALPPPPPPRPAGPIPLGPPPGPVS